MFGIGYVELLVAGAVVLLGVVMWRVGSRAAWAGVDDHTTVAEAIGHAVAELPSAVPRPDVVAVT